MGKRKHITQGEYNRIKHAQKSGMSIPAVASLADRSYGTVKRIYDTDEYNELYPVKYAPIAMETVEEPETSDSSVNATSDTMAQLEAAHKLLGDAIIELKKTSKPKVAGWFSKYI